MKSDLLIVLCVILAGIAGFFAYKYYTERKYVVATAKSSASLDSSYNAKPLVIYRDTNGVQHVVIDNKVNSIIQKEATKAASAITDNLQAIADNLGIKVKDLQSGTTVTTQTDLSDITLKKKNDSLQSLIYFYKDKYVNATVKINKVENTDSAILDLAYNADLNINQYSKRSWFLGAKKSYIDISSNDPRTTILGVKRYIVEQNQPEFGARIKASAAYNPDLRSLSVGPSATIDIGRTQLRGTYYYNFQAKDWRPSIVLERDLIRF